MKFYKFSSNETVAKLIAAKLSAALTSGKSVLWLVPGGSSITIAAEVSNQLRGLDLQRLTVSLTDERYGPLGHADSNWLQLERAGFRLDGANLQPVLIGKARTETAGYFSDNLEKMLAGADYSLGFFGIGPDGHTAGILPGSLAVNDTSFAAGYTAGNFERITMTPRAIARLSEAIVYAIGEAKWPILDQLEQELPLGRQPAQALKSVPELTIFNDYKGEEV